MRSRGRSRASRPFIFYNVSLWASGSPLRHRKGRQGLFDQVCLRGVSFRHARYPRMAWTAGSHIRVLLEDVRLGGIVR
ncbi:hypothetical protein [Arthrobacter sp. ZGTC412]|uniref:hypothetical protein n=1 Tax=Arthrobacter sp. ZGTC412 TaxID=2058900 RepID=UPI0011B0A8AD|nr:hypothetical protein [Arthrobacter sp. ZGTC412]